MQRGQPAWAALVAYVQEFACICNRVGTLLTKLASLLGNHHFSGKLRVTAK